MSLPLSLRLALREVRSGPLLPVLLALVMASVATSGTYAASARLESAILGQASQFIAADLVVRGLEPAPDSWKSRAEQLGLRYTETVEFASMAYAGEHSSMLVFVKAVGAGYPLRGELLAAGSDAAADGAGGLRVQPGQAWLDKRLLEALGLSVGQPVEIADGSFQASHQLVKEPDRASSMGALLPRALISLSDVDRTGAVLPGSRVEWRFLVAGEAQPVAQLIEEIKAEDLPGYRLISPAAREGASGTAVRNGLIYIRLSGTLVLLLALLSGALAARRYFADQRRRVALLKTLGISGGSLLRLYLAKLGWVCTLALALGTACGWLIQQWFGDFLWREFATATQSVSPAVLLLAAMTALVGLLAILAPLLASAIATEPVSLLRSVEDGGAGNRSAAVSAVAVVALLLATVGLLPATILLAVLALLALAALGVSRLLAALGRLKTHSASAWGLMCASLRQRQRANAMQLFALAMVVLPLAILYGMRQDLFESWDRQLAQGTPNFFLANVSSQEKDRLRQALDDLGADSSPFAPTLRAAWTSLRKADGTQMPLPEDRPVNLSWAAEVPEGSELIAGEWWSDDRAAEVSLEDEYAEEIGAVPGDFLQVRLGGQHRTLKVVSLRKINWLSLSPNFWALVPPGLLADAPVTWISSFYLPEDKSLGLSRVLRSHPTVNLFEIGALLDEAVSMIGRLSAALTLMLILLATAAVLVLFEGLVFDLAERKSQTALLRVLGVQGGRLLGALTLELALLGVAGSFFGALGADLFLWLLSLGEEFLQSRIHWQNWLYACVICVWLLLLPGVPIFRKALATPPSVVMRSSEGFS